MADDRFNFPIKQYLQQLVRDNQPDLNTQPGSAIHDLVIVPMSLVAQDVNDKVNILKQSSTISNYAVMTQEEMDKLAANFFLERRLGATAYGTIRVYFTRKRPVNITSNNVFFSGELRWVPINPKSYSIEELSYDPTTTEFYIDVSSEGDTEGEEYTLSAGDVVSLEGIEISRAVALFDFVLGTNEDTNTELFDRIQSTIANNELVKPSAIEKLLQEEFNTIRNIAVIGYGDPGMDRDIIKVSLPLEDMFGVNLCNKVMLPLDENGEVAWYDSMGNLNIAPIGGWVGAIYDVNDKDFNNLPITWDGENYTTVSVQPGFVVRFLAQGTVSDPDSGDHYVSRVEDAPIIAGGAPRQVIRLDGPLLDTISTGYQYKLLGNVGVNSFHVGGKIDTAIDDTSNEELSVIVDQADEVLPSGSNIIEIPLTSEQALHASGDPMFEDNITFVEPVLAILRLEQVSFGASTNVEKVLVPFRDYTIVRAESRQKYTSAPYDVLRIMAKQIIGSVELNPYIGQRLRIVYLANRQLGYIQEYLDNPSNKTVDIKVVPPSYVYLDVDVTYRGTDLDEDTAISLIKEYITSTSFGVSISASDITQLLLIAGATYVKQPLSLKATRLYPNGVVEDIESSDIVDIGSKEIFYPVTDMLNITREEG